MKSRELDYASDATADYLRELVRLRSAGLLPELQPFAKVVDLEAGYLARAFRTAIMEAVKWGQENPREPPTEYATPLREPTTAPPVAGWDDDAVTPLEEPGYELTGDIRRLLQPLDRRPTRQVADPLAQVPPGKTIRSSPPPVPQQVDRDVLSSRLKRRP